MKLHCTTCSDEFYLSSLELKLLDTVSPVAGHSFLPPSQCPVCREKTRLCFRNEKSLYKRKCDSTGKSIISMYRPDVNLKVYDRDYWWNESFNPLSYAREFDFSRSFFEQFEELYLDVPHSSIYHMSRNENSNYSNYALDTKDCYYSFSVVKSEGCLYVANVNDCLNCLDCLSSVNCELCYECVDCSGCYSSSFLTRCKDCKDSAFCSYCYNCSDCIGCSNLHRAKFCIFNEQLGEEEYLKRKKELFPLTRFKQAEFEKKSSSLCSKQPKRYAQIINSENSSGNYIKNSKNCYNCFDVENVEDCSHLTRSFDCRDSSDGYGISGHELTYQVMSGRGQRLSFAISSYDNSDCSYIVSCFNCLNVFGSVGLRKQSFCLLNKKYSPDEYAKLIVRVAEHMKKTGEWGKFFPKSLSPFGYNETISNELYPCSKEEATEAGFHWSDYKQALSEFENVYTEETLPEDLSLIDGEPVVLCKETKRPFRVTKQEINFYRANGIPLPTLSPDSRYRKRLLRRNPKKVWRRACEECGEFLQSTYSLEKPELVYCGECYSKEVFQ